MSQFYKTHLAFSRGCFEAIFVKNTRGCLGVKKFITKEKCKSQIALSSRLTFSIAMLDV
jgi:hypothetical protein